MDLEHLTLAQIVIGLFSITVLDFISGVAGAFANHTFSVDSIAQFVATHILGRVIPLSFAAAVGIGLPVLNLPPSPAIFAVFLAGGAAYVAETLASIVKNLGSQPAKA